VSEEIPFVTDMIRGYLKRQIVRTIATLSIADLLAKGPASLGYLEEKTGADPDGLERLLRAAVTLGFVVYAEGQYRATARLEVLREDAPTSLKYLAIGLAGPSQWGPCGRLPEAVKTGAVQSTAALGRPVFEHFAANPQEAADFMRFMQAASESVQAEVLRLLDLSGATCAVDLGGGNGALLCALAKANPHLKGVVYDLPHSHDAGLAFAAAKGLADRITIESGDFFASVPAADVYLMKWILHDWDDSSCVKILSNCRRAIAGQGRVVLVEYRLGEISDPGRGALADLHMLAVTGGRERTAAQYGQLLDAAGFRLKSVKPTVTPFDILEAVIA
jgi:hypothetical protein